MREAIQGPNATSDLADLTGAAETTGKRRTAAAQAARREGRLSLQGDRSNGASVEVCYSKSDSTGRVEGSLGFANNNQAVTINANPITRIEHDAAERHGCLLACGPTAFCPARHGAKCKNSQINRLQGASVTNGAVDDHPGPPVAQRQARHPLSEQRDPAGARTVDDKDAAPSFLFEHAPDRRGVFIDSQAGDPACHFATGTIGRQRQLTHPGVGA